MPKRESLPERVADVLDLPRDLLSDLFRLTLIGRGQLCIENHKGIIIYEDDLIRVAVRGGAIAVTGRGLKVRSVYTHEISIEGQIDNIDLGGKG